MFFKRNKNQENDCDVYQGKHETDTWYLVKLDDGQYISKNYYNGTVNQGTDSRFNYMIYDLKDAKRTQQDYGGIIYKVVTDTCIRPYQGRSCKTGGYISAHDESEIGDRPEAVIKQPKHVTFISSNSNIKLPDEFLIDGIKYSKHVDKPHVNAETEAKSEPHIRIDIPAIDDHPRIYVDGYRIATELNQLTLRYFADGSQSIDAKYFVDEHISYFKEQTLEYSDSRNINTNKFKIHELAKREQPVACYSNERIGYYSAFIYSPETIELLNKPNTRLVIIEDDEDA